MTTQAPRWTSLSSYLRQTFGERVSKVMLDGGFTCPNIDGSKALGGCTFCDAHGSGPAARVLARSIQDQLAYEIDRARGNGVHKFLAYLQAHTNTYAPVESLRTIYTEALNHPDVVGLAIGARADSVPDEVLDFLAEIAQETHLWLEFGLQSASDETLRRTNRAETVAEFIDSVERAHLRGLRVCGHVMFGFPWETREMMMATVDLVAGLRLEGVKLHSLYLVPGTALHEEVMRDGLTLLGQDDYAELVVDALERLPVDMVVHRLMADPPYRLPAIPEWTRDKNGTIYRINTLFADRGTAQGSRYDAAASSRAVERVRLTVPTV
jgi:uncharacterized protein